MWNMVFVRRCTIFRGRDVTYGLGIDSVRLSVDMNDRGRSREGSVVRAL